ncbi:hypothetical protein C1I98_32825 [Spongiactinospora gelatinilytica]|uniref:Uncharacterized protein n=1 Tax=Spongiactinospora gelatinilytica TaxID=2666298 RepID=A0A2W2FV34_9ACTN|nr:hypothetical protein [Spongiactinospora gelatinilytica]PZG28428.1 hypothetical protein C1I98_32825 [Spongiactinospora gelatinilytica]
MLDAQQVLGKLTGALTESGSRVHENDDVIPERAPFPGDAIAYIFHDQVELYLLDGTLRDELSHVLAADRVAKAIDAAGLQASEDASTHLVNGRVVVTTA